MRILLGITHPLIRYGLEQLLRDLESIEYMVTVETKEDALKKLQQFPFDRVVLHDGLSGVLPIVSLRKQAGRALFILLYEKQPGVDSMYFHYRMAADTRIEGWEKNWRSMKRTAASTEIAAAGPQEGEMTRREEEVFRLKVNGYSVRDSAQLLGITSKTVENHRRNIAKKRQLKNNQDWIKEAAALGWLP
ncbi:response regulator transcription factor [Alkalicoccus chagannorensis]|uniref:response regulator transcription factor n=1 Tax=Alkalicoccus chagannorensis TaxID=427072 RepID=UPI0003FBF460|nr:LuxR C-terminal-related transcriptional regulator [Alkalicoccus chagannorensis]